ncbi:MAG: ABC transporter substrate-binding protein [Trueperaceae bacterium]|nr:ABC transporter substrate-binding protein [Trueperaceae bacterium]
MKKLLVLLAALGVCVAFAGDPNTYVEQSFGDVDTLDPVQAYDSASGQVIENVYEGLYGYKGDSVTEYEPRLATSYEESADGMTYTFSLREGVSFHSGNSFTCKDVEYSIERALVTNPPDSGAWILMEPLTGLFSDATTELGDGATDEQYADVWSTIDNSVVCLDDYTVQFNLVAPDPAFFSKMLFYAANIVDSEWAKANGMWDGTAATWRDFIGVDLRDYYLQNNMSGTGAYKLVAWEPGIRVVAEANADYWGGAPSIANVVLQQVEDEASRIQALKAGDADTVALGARSSLPQVEGQPGIVVLDAAKDPSLGWSSVAVNAVFMAQDINQSDNTNIGSGDLGLGIPSDFFTDIHVRKCFNYAFDTETYINDVLDGAGEVITMALPTSYLGYDPNVPVYEYDLEKAEEECKQAWGGRLWDEGMYLTFSYNTGNSSRQAVAEILKSNLEYLNPKFKIDVRGIQWSQFLDERRNNRLPASIIGWIPDYADPDNYIHTFYATTGYYSAQTGFSDPEIDAIDEQARTELDPAKRAELYSQLGNMAYEKAPYILLPQSVPFMIMREEVSGYYRNPMLSGSYLWKDLSKQ